MKLPEFSYNNELCICASREVYNKPQGQIISVRPKKKTFEKEKYASIVFIEQTFILLFRDLIP